MRGGFRADEDFKKSPGQTQNSNQKFKDSRESTLLQMVSLAMKESQRDPPAKEIARASSERIPSPFIDYNIVLLECWTNDRNLSIRCVFFYSYT